MILISIYFIIIVIIYLLIYLLFGPRNELSKEAIHVKFNVYEVKWGKTVTITYHTECE